MSWRGLGGMRARLSDSGQRSLMVDLTSGEPAAFAAPGGRAEQAGEAARILGVDRVCLVAKDRLLADTPALRLEVARLIRQYRPRWVYGIGDACVHPDHAATVGLTRATVFWSRLGQRERVPGGERLVGQDPWAIDRLSFPHGKMEPSWSELAFAVDVTSVYERKRRAWATYRSISVRRVISCFSCMRRKASLTGVCSVSAPLRSAAAPLRSWGTTRRCSVRPSTGEIDRTQSSGRAVAHLPSSRQETAGTGRCTLGQEVDALTSVLIVDDEPNLVELVRHYLEQEGLRVQTAADGPSGLAPARRDQPDLVILDVMLPGMDGIEVCRHLRQFSDAYVLMLTARAEEIDKIIGLSIGADDYVTKPFSPRELVARVKAMLRRPRNAAPAQPDAPPVRRFGDLTLDEGRHEVRKAGAPIALTAREFALLQALAGQPQRVFTRAQLLERIWGDEYYDDHVVDVHVANLRKRLEDDPAHPRYIETVRGAGYRFGVRPD